MSGVHRSARILGGQGKCAELAVGVHWPGLFHTSAREVVRISYRLMWAPSDRRCRAQVRETDFLCKPSSMSMGSCPVAAGPRLILEVHKNRPDAAPTYAPEGPGKRRPLVHRTGRGLRGTDLPRLQRLRAGSREDRSRDRPFRRALRGPVVAEPVCGYGRPGARAPPGGEPHTRSRHQLPDLLETSTSPGSDNDATRALVNGNSGNLAVGELTFSVALPAE